MNRIKEWRDLRGLTQAEVGKLVKSTQSQVNKLEKDERTLDLEWLLALSAVLNCRPIDLLDRSSIIDYIRVFLHRGEANEESMKVIRGKIIPSLLELNNPIAAISGLVEHATKQNKSISESGPPSTESTKLIDIYSTSRVGGKFVLSKSSKQAKRIALDIDYGVVIFDTAMSPRFSPGQIVYVNRANDPVPGNGVVIRLNDGVGLVREWVGWGIDGEAIVQSYQPEPRRATISGSDVESVDRIIAIDEP